MAVVLDGSTGVSLVQDGVVTAADLASGAITSAALPTGSVLQVVAMPPTTAERGAYSSSTFVTVSNHSVSITPTSASSKIYFSMSSVANPQVNQKWIDVTIYRSIGGASASNIAITDNTNADAFSGAYTSSGGDTHFPINIQHLDSPNTTSEVTYSVYVRNRSNDANIRFNPDNFTSTFVAMEIAG